MLRHIAHIVVLCATGACVWSCATKEIADALTERPGGSGSLKFHVYPAILYGGENVLTVRGDVGLARIDVRVANGEPSSVRIEGAGDIADCPEERTVRISLPEESSTVFGVWVSARDCFGREFGPVYREKRTWRSERVSFPEVVVGKSSCKEFVVTVYDNAATIDSITVPDSLPIRLGFEDANAPVFPITVPKGKELWYNVCFTGLKPGRYVFPVISWTQRDQPAGGYTNYPVSDTGIVTVVESKKE